MAAEDGRSGFLVAAEEAGLLVQPEEHLIARPSPGNTLRRTQAWHYYYLSGLERAAVLAGRRWIGEHDRYRVGAEYPSTARAAAAPGAPTS